MTKEIPKPRTPSPPLSPTSKALLDQFNLQEVKPSTDKVAIPAYFTPEIIDETFKALNNDDPANRLLSLYSYLYTSPQLLPALNEVLPQEYHFQEFEDFINPEEFEFDGYLKKLQLSPLDMRSLPENISDVVYSNFVPQKTDKQNTFISSQQQQPQLEMFQIKPLNIQNYKNIKVSNQQDQQEYESIAKEFDLKDKTSVFTEKFKIEISKKFLNLVKNGPSLTKFKDIMSEYDAQQISQDLLQFCVTLIFFDQIEVLYYFQLMQKNSDLEDKNSNFGWPNSFPVKDEVSVVFNVINKIENYYLGLTKKSSLVVNLYNGVYLPQKKQYENSVNKFSGIKIIKGDFKIFGDQIELKVQHSNGFTFVKIDKQLFNIGNNAEVHTDAFKQLYSQISEQLAIKQKTKKLSQPSIQSQPNIIQPRQQQRNQLTIPKLSPKIDNNYQILNLIKAGKLNHLTIFDLDYFFELMISLCQNKYLNYPSFSYQEFNSRCGFGLSVSIQKGSQQFFTSMKESSVLNWKGLQFRDQNLIQIDKILLLNKNQSTNNEILNNIENLLDSQFFIDPQLKNLLECNEFCQHCTCDYLGEYCLLKCNNQLNLEIVNEIQGLLLCPSIFDYKNLKFKPGVFLRTEKSMFNSFDQLSYDNKLLQFIEFTFNSKFENFQQSMKFEQNLLFGSFLSPRDVNIDAFKDQYQDKFEQLNRIYLNAQQPPKNIDNQLFNSYDTANISSNLLSASFKELNFRLLLSSNTVNYPLSTLHNTSSITSTYSTQLYQNILSQDEIKYILQQEIVDKEPFSFPPIITNDDYEPEVDFSVLKKDSVIVKLKTITQNYKILPSDMYQMHQKQHPELFDLGIYERDKYHVPQTFNETRQMANSVLNRAKYFTIPFGSEAQQVANDVVIDNDIEDTDFRKKSTQNQIKSQYMKFSHPTGAEARVCHIEEEQLCFGLFNMRSNQLLKILLSWMSIFTPEMLKYFSMSVSENWTKSIVLGTNHYKYRQNFDQKQEKMNNYFYQGEYKNYDDSDLLSVQYEPFSQQFDQELVKIAQKYESIDFSNQLDPWVENPTYSPIRIENRQVYPLPSIPHVLQLHLTQLYTTGEIINQMINNPVLTIPIITRTLQKQLFLNQQAEQRAAIAWRILYPESYYKSIDHASVCLLNFDKKYIQNKVFQTDFERRKNDLNCLINPNELDCFIDISLPKIYEFVNFSHLNKFPLSYEKRLKQIQQFIPSSILNIPFKFTYEELQIEIGKQSLLSQDEKFVKNMHQLIKKLTLSCANGFEPFSHDSKQKITDRLTLPENIQNLTTTFPQMNFSVLFPSDIHSQLLSSFLSDLGNSLPNNQPQQPPPSPPAYIEDFISDLKKQRNLQINDAEHQLYSEQNSRQLFDSLKQINLPPSDYDFCRAQLEKLIESNAFIPSIFNGSSLKNLIFCTKFRHISIPICSIRSIFVLRVVFFNEKFDFSVMKKAYENELTYDEMTEFLANSRENAKNQIFSSTKSDQSQLQQELCKKQIFDEIFIPILAKNSSKIAIIDDEMLCNLRIFSIIITRIEFSLQILQKTTPSTRQSAVVSTRFLHNFPYNYTSQLHYGCTIFGNDLKQHFEQQKFSKQLIETVPVQVSQRIFYGHQPYINLQNTTNENVANCKCGQLKCAFCGGIGAGTNGGVSGSVNSRFTTPIDLNFTLANGRNQIKKLYDIEEITDSNLILFSTPPQIPLLYKLDPIVPNFKFINQFFESEDDTKQFRKQLRRGSKSETESSENQEPDDEFIAKKLLQSKGVLEYFSSDFGGRLSDVLTLPPLNAVKQPNSFEKCASEMTFSPLTQETPIWTIQEFLGISDEKVFLFDDVVLIGMSQGVDTVEFEKFLFGRGKLNNERLYEDQFENFMQLFGLIMGNKDDEYGTEVYSVLGIYSYPFMSLKKHIQNLQKKFDGLSSKMLNHHFNAENLTIYKSNKSNYQNQVSVLILTILLFQERSGLNSFGVGLDKQFINSLSENGEEIYLLEGGNEGFVNVMGVNGNGK